MHKEVTSETQPLVARAQRSLGTSEILRTGKYTVGARSLPGPSHVT